MNRRLRLLRCVPVALLLALLAGCGQHGPLYLRENPPPGLKPERPAAIQPVPYPKASDEDKGAGTSQK